MAKQHSQFVCTRCGAAQQRWMGKCPACGEWDALEERVVHDVAPDKHRPLAPQDSDAPLAMPMSDVRPDATLRYSTGIPEFDRVLGGGLVPGSAILVGGDPGIGKSTLLLQVGHALAAQNGSPNAAGQSNDGSAAGSPRQASRRISAGTPGSQSGETPDRPSRMPAQRHRVLYVTSEESLGQTRLRAERLGLAGSRMLVAAQTNLDIISNIIQQQQPDVVVIDSIQMVYRPDLASSPGSVTQLRDAAARLIWLAKQAGFALLMVGHVTKEGAIAGPKILEHLVDCVAYFEGDRFHAHRIVRAVKNRYGSTDELGIFEMTDGGLSPVPDPSKLFLAEKREARPGSVILAACEGTRTLLVEVQALCAQSVFGAAKRKATGVDAGRVAMLLAVIEKHAQCVLGDQDVFVNVVGGVKVTEPAADLAIALAVYTAMTNRCLPPGTVVCGELGLGAELRPVHHQRQRAAEAARVGFTRFIAPRAVESGRRAAESGGTAGLECVACGTLQHAIQQLS